MNVTRKLAITILVGTPLVGIADEPTKLSCAKDVTFSQEFLAKYPKAPAACREVMMKDGEKWISFNAHVVKVEGNNVTANFTDDFHNVVAKLTVSAAPDARIDVGGTPTKFSSLHEGDKLSFWVPESKFGFYAAPGASESNKFTVVK